jgi:hypothetical protein
MDIPLVRVSLQRLRLYTSDGKRDGIQQCFYASSSTITVYEKRVTLDFWNGSVSNNSIAAARHASVFDECTAVPVVTIAMSDYGRTKDHPW